MHLAEFLSGPNKRRDRGRLSAKNATRTTNPSSRTFLFNRPRKSSGAHRGPVAPTIPPCQPPKVVKYSADVFLSPPPLAGPPTRSSLLPLNQLISVSRSRSPNGPTLLRIRYVNREDDNQTETDRASSIHLFVLFADARGPGLDRLFCLRTAALLNFVRFAVRFGTGEIVRQPFTLGNFCPVVEPCKWDFDRVETTSPSFYISR